MKVSLKSTVLIDDVSFEKKNFDHPLISMLANQENIREKGSFVCAHSARDQRTCERNSC